MPSRPFPTFARRLPLVLATLLAGSGLASAQRPPAQLDGAEILHRLHKLDVLGSVLYIAAHPDDENTRLISYLSNGRKVRTAYLSLTRGDGGQNLIGPELGDALGILRTQELLEARRIDGGEQFFTRAVDFGYSKSPEETFAKWGKQEVLADVVRVVRTFRPDVILTRFATDGSGGHGHHTASAILAQEAFDLAADPRAFPDQLTQGLEPWQAKRLFFNASTWWRSDLAELVQKDPANWVALDVGGFDPLLGVSYTELAGRSRSQHKSQGFGAAETRGELTEYLHFEKGAKPLSQDIFDGLELSWKRISGGERAGALIDAMIRSYDPSAPEQSTDELSALVRVLDELSSGPGLDQGWAKHQARAARQLILQACGMVIEAAASSFRFAVGDSLSVSLATMQRGPTPSLWIQGLAGPGQARISVGESLPWNRPIAKQMAYTTLSAQPIDQPYWLGQPHATLYVADGLEYTGIEPDSRARISFTASLSLPDGLEVSAERALMNKWVDRVAGERTRSVVITPVASIEPFDRVLIFKDESVTAAVELRALTDDLSGMLRVSLPAGWSMEKPFEPVKQLRSGEQRRFEFELRRSPRAVAGVARFSFEGPKGGSERTMHVIDYAHILPQTWYTLAEIQLVPLDVEVTARSVGYIKGAGDEVPQALHQLGVAVELIDLATTSPADMARYDTIVTGIRAYNTLPRLVKFNPLLLAFVENGGTLLVQYNTNGGDLVLDPKQLGPHPFVLTRERVTVEEAPATFLDPTHPLLNSPNRLSAADFEGWVQERGLYFAGELDSKYKALIAWNDPGEKPSSGGLITCDHGKGRYVYTGISLFRQLPAGVPGAYRLLANLISRRSPRE